LAASANRAALRAKRDERDCEGSPDEGPLGLGNDVLAYAFGDATLDAGTAL